MPLEIKYKMLISGVCRIEDECYECLCESAVQNRPKPAIVPAQKHILLSTILKKKNVEKLFANISPLMHVCTVFIFVI